MAIPFSRFRSILVAQPPLAARTHNSLDGLGAAQAPYVWLAAGNSKEPQASRAQ